MSSLELTIRKQVLKNAFDFGRANAGAVVGKVIAEFPDCRSDMKNTMASINAEIVRVGTLTNDQIQVEMGSFEYAEKKKEEKRGIEIPRAEMGKVVVRYPPEPNGWPHIGHAKAFCISWSIAHKYEGKILLRWDDTNPEAEKPEFLDAIRDGIRWLGLDWAEEVYCSDHMPKMYDLCEKLLEQGDAYFCSCPQEAIAKGREEMTRCNCGSQVPASSLANWKHMLDGTIPEGGGTVRLKGNMKSQNTVMRDPTLFRIITTPHYRQKTKYRVWPTYDFQGAVMDSILGITHPLRSKEYELRDELYVYLLNKLGLRVPEMISISRLAIKNAPVSKRLLRPLVEGGKLWGWDDPRLPTLAGLARRGIMPEAIREFVLAFGISKVESEPDLEALLAFNRKLLDSEAKHFFFVRDPVELEVRGLERKEIQLRLHPKKDLGMRTIMSDKSVFITRADADAIKDGETFRLKDLCNVKLVKHFGKRLVGELAPDSMADKKLQWVGADKVSCEVYVPKNLLDGSGNFNPESLEQIKGYCEPACRRIANGEIIQFERFGFSRLDGNEKSTLRFIFTC